MQLMNQVLKRKMSGADTVYYFAFLLYVIASTLKLSMIGQQPIILRIITICRFLGVLLGAGSIFLRKSINRRYLILIACIIGVFVIVMFTMGDHGGMLMLLVMIGAWKCDSNRICKIYLLGTGSIVAISVIGSFLGIVADRTSIFFRTSSIVLTRHSWGMTYTTVLSGFLYFVIASYLYRKKELTLLGIVLLNGLAIWGYISTYSRLELFMSLLVIWIFVFNKFWKKIYEYKAVRWFCRNIFFISLIISFAFTMIYMYNPAKFSMLDRIMTGRLAQSSQAITKYGFSIFGKAIQMQGAGTLDFDTAFGYFFIDSFYINWSLVYGIVVMTLLCVFFHWILTSLEKKGNSKLILMIVLACLHGIIISSIMQPNFNPFFTMAIAEMSRSGKSASSYPFISAKVI